MKVRDGFIGVPEVSSSRNVLGNIWHLVNSGPFQRQIFALQKYFYEPRNMSVSVDIAIIREEVNSIRDREFTGIFTVSPYQPLPVPSSIALKNTLLRRRGMVCTSIKSISTALKYCKHSNIGAFREFYKSGFGDIFQPCWRCAMESAC